MLDETSVRQDLEQLFTGLHAAVEVERARRREVQQEFGAFFDNLQENVEEIAVGRRRTLTANVNIDLTRLFSILEPTLAAATIAIRVLEERERVERDRRTGRRFTAFDLVRTQELDLSRIFAGLLRSTGDHSQGNLFLWLLIEELSVAHAKAAELLRAFQPSSSYTVHLEYPIRDEAKLPGQKIAGSVDIVLEIEGNRWIAIENKPSAVDQPLQVDRYLFALAHEVEQGGGREDQIALLYWSGDGSDPDLPDLTQFDSSWDKATRERQERLRSRCLTVPYRKAFGYPSVEGWIRRCWVECESDRVRSFLRQLMEYIQRHF